MDEKFKEEKEYLQSVIENNNQTWEDKINKIKELVDSDVEILKEAIDNNRTIFSNKLQNVLDTMENYHKNNSHNLMKMLNDIDAVRKYIDNLKKDITALTNSVSEDILAVRSYVEVELMNERALRADIMKEFYDEINSKV